MNTVTILNFVKENLIQLIIKNQNKLSSLKSVCDISTNYLTKITIDNILVVFVKKRK